MVKVLVTGANGFVGQNLVQSLLERGEEVTCLVRPSSRLDALKPFGVRVLYGDVTQAESLPEAVRDAEVVYHLAGCTRACREAELVRVNATGTAHVVAACAARTTPPTLVYVSSLAAAGPSHLDRPRRETDPIAPVSVYGRSKRAGEEHLYRYAARLPISLARPPMVFGPGARDMRPMFRSVQLGLHFVPGRRPQRFSLIDVRDLVELLILLAQQGRRLGAVDDPEVPGVYNAGMPEMPTYVELGQLLAHALGRRHYLTLQAPHALVRLLAAVNTVRSRIAGRPLLLNTDKLREAVAGSWTCSGERAAVELGFVFRHSLAERLTQAVQWYRQHGWL